MIWLSNCLGGFQGNVCFRSFSLHLFSETHSHSVVHPEWPGIPYADKAQTTTVYLPQPPKCWITDISQMPLADFLSDALA